MIERLKRPLISVLRWSERYTKTDMVYLASGGFWLGFGQILSSICAFAIAIAFANLLPPDIYGTYKFILSVAALIAIPTLSGLNTALVRAIAQGNEGNIKKTISLKLQWGFVAFLCGIGIASYYFIQGNTLLASTFFIVAALTPLMEIGGLYSAILNGRKKFRENTLYEGVFQICITLLLIATVFFTHNLILLVFLYFFLWTVGRLIALYSVKRTIGGKEDFSKESITLGKHLSVINILNIIGNNIDKVLLFHFLGPVSVAVYAIALAPVQQIRNAVSLIKPLTLPRLSVGGKISNKKYALSFLFLMLLLSILAVVYILLSPMLFALIFPQYIEALFYSQVLALSILSGLVFYNSSILIALNAHRSLYFQTTVTNIIQITGIFVGVIYWGIWGVICAFIFSKVVHTILGTVAVIRYKTTPIQTQ